MKSGKGVIEKKNWTYKTVKEGGEMTYQEYIEIGNKYGLTLYSYFGIDRDLGYSIDDIEFISVCGYRSERKDGCWPDGSVIFYNEQGFWNGEWFDTVDGLEERILSEIEKKKAMISKYRISRIDKDFV